MMKTNAKIKDPVSSSSDYLAASKKVDREQIAAVLWGNTMEYFDSLMYVHMMVIITTLFFPPNDHLALSILATTGFAVNYLARPVGAFFFGYIGDKFGRRLSLYVSITMMLLATGFIGVLPVYAQVGVYASISLLILRFFQGISCSGEATGALVYVMESIPYHQRFFYSALYNATIISGGVIAALVIVFSLSFLKAENAWRYPFQIAALVGIVGLLMRYNLSETKEFKAKKKQIKETSLRKTLLQKQNIRSMLRVAGFASFDASTFWVCYVFLADLLKTQVGLNPTKIVLHNGGVMIFQILTGFMIAKVALRMGERKLGLFAIHSLALLILPVFILVKLSNFSYAAITLAQLITISSGNAFVIATDPLRVFLFPVIGRFMGMAVGISLGRVMGYVIGAYLLIAFDYMFGYIGGAIYILIFTLPAWWAIRTVDSKTLTFRGEKDVESN